MKVERRSVDDVVILQVIGEVTYGKGSDVLLRTRSWPRGIAR